MFLAIRELKYEKGRYGLILGILMLLVFLVLFLTGITRGLSAATSSAIDNAAAQSYILSNDADGIITRSAISEALWEDLANETSTPINIQRMSIVRDEQKIDITYMAVDVNGFMMPSLYEGHKPGLNEVVLDVSFIDFGFKAGDIVEDSASGQKLTVVGFAKGQMYGHSSLGIVSHDTFKPMMNAIRPGSYTYNAVASNADKAHTEALDDTVVLSQAEVINKIPGHAQEQTTLTLILVVLMGVSAFILGTFFYVTTMQKLSEFGVLKALGASTSFLANAVISQVLVLTIISLLIGNALTFGLAQMLPKKMPFILSGMDALLVSIAFIFISMISSLFSLRKVSKVDPLQAIGGNDA